MSVVFTVVASEFTGNTLRVHGTAKLTNTVNYATGGDPFSLAGIDLIKASGLPFKVFIISGLAGQTNLFEYNYAPGTTLANGKLQVFTGAAAQTAMTELNAGAYPAGCLADILLVEILFLVRNS